MILLFPRFFVYFEISWFWFLDLSAFNLDFYSKASTSSFKQMFDEQKFLLYILGIDIYTLDTNIYS